MNLSYINSVDDIAAFTRYHYKSSPAVRRTLLVSQLIGTAAIFTVVALVNYKADMLTRMIPAALFAAVYFFACPYLLIRSAVKQVRHSFSEATANGASAEHNLEVTDQGIVEHSAEGELLCPWEDLGPIQTVGMRTFIYVGPHMAHIIPLAAVDADEYETFMQAVRQGEPPGVPLQELQAAPHDSGQVTGEHEPQQ